MFWEPQNTQKAKMLEISKRFIATFLQLWALMINILHIECLNNAPDQFLSCSWIFRIHLHTIKDLKKESIFLLIFSILCSLRRSSELPLDANAMQMAQIGCFFSLQKMSISYEIWIAFTLYETYANILPGGYFLFTFLLNGIKNFKYNILSS